MKKNFLLVYLFLFNFLNAQVIQINSIEEVKNYLNSGEKTLFVFDIDNTFLELKDTQIGSDQWVSGFVDYEIQNGKTVNQAYDVVLPIYFDVTKNAQFVPTEKSLIDDLFDKLISLNIETVALTARSKPLMNSTYNLLQEHKMLPSLSNLSQDEVYLVNSGGRASALYFKGTVHCANNNKGECLQKFIDLFKDQHESLSDIKKIIMIDDKEKNLKAVEEVFEKLGIEFIGLRYGYLDDKVKNFVFNPEIHIPKLEQKSFLIKLQNYFLSIFKYILTSLS